MASPNQLTLGRVKQVFLCSRLIVDFIILHSSFFILHSLLPAMMLMTATMSLMSTTKSSFTSANLYFAFPAIWLIRATMSEIFTFVSSFTSPLRWVPYSSLPVMITHCLSRALPEAPTTTKSVPLLEMIPPTGCSTVPLIPFVILIHSG